MIKTFVVNLKTSVERRRYMENILSAYDCLDVEFFDAVYGKSLTQEELTARVDKKLAYNRYGRDLGPGEIGCTLSHLGIYEALSKSSLNYCLILEDDITILEDISCLPSLTRFIDCDQPRILFLSGDYWFTGGENAPDDKKIVKVYDSVGSYAYFINKAAAELILKKNARCAHTADNWVLFRQQGVKLFAVYPYMIDANIESFESDVQQSRFGYVRENMSFRWRLLSYWVAAIKKIMVKSGHFVAKIRVPRC